MESCTTICVADFKPVSSNPAGVLVFGAILYARLLSIPLVVSYHTHIPHYIPQ